MVVVLEVRNHYKYTKMARRRRLRRRRRRRPLRFLDNSATSGGEGANATAAGPST